MSDSKELLSIEDLQVRILQDEGEVRPLNGVDIKIHQGQAIGIVGESGCGKTMTANATLRTLPRTAKITAGKIHFTRKDGSIIDIVGMNPKGRDIRRIRGAEISMIFQEPMTALSPVYTISNQISEAIRIHRPDKNKEEIRERVIELLKLVGIPGAESRADSYPFEFSGGMRQRAMIAMALACEPRLLIADEPTTALDVTVQAQVLRVIKDLQSKLGLSLMLITHDLGVVAHMVDYIYVMYMGQVVERGPTEAIFEAPKHPYTRDLLHSIPSLTGDVEEISSIRGSVPNPYMRLSGCPFHPRCNDFIKGLCEHYNPPETKVGKNHFARCVKYEESKLATVAHE